MDVITLGLVTTIDPATGGVDKIITGSGDDIALGGAAGDTLNLGDGNNIVLRRRRSDRLYARAERMPASTPGANLDPANIDLITSTDTGIGGDDTITTGTGTDIIIGGTGADTITASDLTKNASGAYVNADGRNLVFGDNGQIIAASSDTSRFGAQPITLGLVTTIDPVNGGADSITTTGGDDIAFGGTGTKTVLVNNAPVVVGDTLNLGDGNNIAFGDDGEIDYTAAERTPGRAGCEHQPREH